MFISYNTSDFLQLNFSDTNYIETLTNNNDKYTIETN